MLGALRKAAATARPPNPVSQNEAISQGLASGAAAVDGSGRDGRRKSPPKGARSASPASGTKAAARKRKKKEPQEAAASPSPRLRSPRRISSIAETARVPLAGRNKDSRRSELIDKIAEREAMARAEGQGGEGASPEGQTPKTRAGMEILTSVTDESNELVRRIERQKRTVEQQQQQIVEVTRKLEQVRKELRAQQRMAKGARKIGSKQEAYVARLDALHLRLNDAITRDKEIRVSINEMRYQQMDDMLLQREMIEERQAIAVRREEVLKDIEAAKAREADIRAEIRRTNEEAERIVAEMKEEWQALGVFVGAKSERERMRLWQEKKERELKMAEEETRKREEAKKALLQFSPFSSAFEKGQSRRNVQGAVMRRQGSRSGLSGVGPHGSISMHMRDLEDLSNTALAGNLTVNEEKALKSNIQASRWQIARGQVALQALDGKASTLEEGFNLIKAKTGIETPADMVETFLQREEEIFRLFTHVNLLSEQIEELESCVTVEREEIERYRGKDGESTSGRSILKQLDDRLDRLVTRTAVQEEVGSQASRIVDQVKNAVASMFVRIGCDTKLIESFCFHTGTAGISDPDAFRQRADKEAGGADRDASALERSRSDGGVEGSPTAPGVLSAEPVRTSNQVRSPPNSPGLRSGNGRMSPSSPRGGNATTLRKRLKRGAPFEDPSIDSFDEQAAGRGGAVPKLEITEKNLLQYIGVIEQRVSELLMIYNIVNKQKPQDHWKDARPVRPLPALPSTERENEDWSDDEPDEDALRPLSYEELLHRVSNAVDKD